MVGEEAIYRLVLCGHLHYFCFSKLSLLCVFRPQPLCKWGPCSFGTLGSIYHLLVTDVSGWPVGPIFKGPELLDPWRWAILKHQWLTTDQRCLTSLKCEDLIFVLLPLYLHSLFHVIFFPVSFEVCLVVSFSVTWMLPLFITAKPFFLKH